MLLVAARLRTAPPATPATPTTHSCLLPAARASPTPIPIPIPNCIPSSPAAGGKGKYAGMIRQLNKNQDGLVDMDELCEVRAHL